MKFRYIILLMFSLFILTVAAVSASDVNNSTIQVSGEIPTDNVVGQDLNVNNVVNEGNGTFTDLQKLIDDNDVINLTKDYTAVESEGRIHISSDKIINGNGYAINGNEKTGIFQIDDGKIVFNDMVIKNGHSQTKEDNNGGAIRVLKAGSLTFNNVAFLNNYAKYSGGAIWTTAPLNIVNCTFQSNKADKETVKPIVKDGIGGAIYAGTTSVNIKNSIFNYNHADRFGGAIYAKNVNVDNCTFLNNYAKNCGGAIYADSVSWVDSPSYFIGNRAYYNGGAIFTSKFDTDVKHGVFINNTAEFSGVYVMHNGGAIFISDENHVTFSQCYFEKNHCSDDGGAIYLDSKSSHVSLRNNVFVDNSAGSKGNIVYNSGYYDEIKNNWYGTNSLDFKNQFKECHWYGDEDHADNDPVITRLVLNDNPYVGVNISLDVEFMPRSLTTMGDALFNLGAKFDANNGVVFTNPQNGDNKITSDILLTHTGITIISATINNQVLSLTCYPSEGYIGKWFNKN